MSIKAIVFDKDGTLMRFEDFWIPTAEHAVGLILSSLGIDKSKSQIFLDSIGTYDGKSGVLCHGTYKDMADAFSEVLKDLNISCDEEKLLKLVSGSFHQSMRFGEIKSVCSNLPAILSSFKKSGLILSLVTSDDIHGTQKFLSTLKITDYFDEICTFDEIHPSKPNPYYMKMLCLKYNLKPCEIIMVGDTAADMNFAANAGVTAIGIAEKSDDQKHLRNYTEYVLCNVSELAELLSKME